MSLTLAPRGANPSVDPTSREAGLDPRARHPGHREVVARWRTASALVRRIESSRRDVRYGEGEGETLDLYPTPRADAPVLVFLGGDFGAAYDKSDHAFLAPAFTAAGALVVVPGHADPAAGLEHVALQTTRAFAWVHRHAALYGGDPRRIVAVGHAAGGHLAAMLLGCRWKDVDAVLPPQLLAGALAVSGLFDLEPLRQAPSLQAGLKLTPASVRRLSPAFFPRPRKPLAVAVGLDEGAESRRQAALIRDQWGPTAVPVVETIPGVDHYTILHGLADPRARLHRMALRLLGLG